MKHAEEYWETKDHLCIYEHRWEPEAPPKAILCLVHGLGEHSGRYQHVADYITQRGYVLQAFDLRGHGKSGGRRGYVPDFKAVLDDTDIFLSRTAELFPGIPLFLYGHSLGGTLVIAFALQAWQAPANRPSFSSQLAGIVATGPFFRTAFEPPAWKLSLGKMMNKLIPSFAMSNEIDHQALSRDSQVVHAYGVDPLVHDRISARLAMELFAAGEGCLEHAGGLSMPLLLMHGSTDRLSSVEASQEFAKRAGTHCTLKIWEGLYHEIHNEPEKMAVFDYLLGWLDERLATSKP